MSSSRLSLYIDRKCTASYFWCRLRFHLLGNRLLLSTASRGGVIQIRGLLKWLFHPPLYNQTKVSQKKRKKTEALFPLLCIMRALFTVNITLHQNPNHECVPYDCYLWVLCKTFQASCLPFDSLQHFGWGYSCRVEASSQHHVLQLICWASVLGSNHCHSLEVKCLDKCPDDSCIAQSH